MKRILFSLLLLTPLSGLSAAAPLTVPWRCEVVPLANHEVVFRIEGREVTRWHFGVEYPRPFFFPFNGPSGVSLTRMGHPGAPNHDHHRSVWFAHHRVDGIDFWSDQTAARVRQKQWYVYQDGHDEGILAVGLGWYDADGVERLQQDVIAAVIPLGEREWALELQLNFRPGEGRESVHLEKTNFGFLAVRVAKTLSGHFGGGVISDDKGRRGESIVFGKRSRWMDYSGSVFVEADAGRRVEIEGITYFDHPSNRHYPTHWHVREDGWMGAALGLAEGIQIDRSASLTLRYLLLSHRGAFDLKRSREVAESFASRPGFVLQKSGRKHQEFEVVRAPLARP